jgi:hypothetical protein
MMLRQLTRDCVQTSSRYQRTQTPNFERPGLARGLKFHSKEIPVAEAHRLADNMIDEMSRSLPGEIDKKEVSLLCTAIVVVGRKIRGTKEQTTVAAPSHPLVPMIKQHSLSSQSLMYSPAGSIKSNTNSRK